jgi:gas vesicle protein
MKASKGKRAAKPSQALNNMATGAAIGAVTGAAKAVLPAEKAGPKRDSGKA